MSLYQKKYRRETIRAYWTEYTDDGCYFITICTKYRIPWFGDIRKRQMNVSEIGRIVAHEWQQSEWLRYYIWLDKWIVMPNHVHGIIWIERDVVVDGINGMMRWNMFRACVDLFFHTLVATQRRCVATMRLRPKRSPFIYWKPHSIGRIVKQFKSKCTKRIRSMGYRDFAWQSGYYDYIIRNEKSLKKIRRYIQRNPAMWDRDRNNPELFNEEDLPYSS